MSEYTSYVLALAIVVGAFTTMITVASFKKESCIKEMSANHYPVDDIQKVCNF